jgi:hypothetical protein
MTLMAAVAMAIKAQASFPAITRGKRDEGGGEQGAVFGSLVFSRSFWQCFFRTKYMYQKHPFEAETS